MAVAYDNSANTTYANTSTFTHSSFAPSGTPTAIVIGVTYGNTGHQTLNSVTYGGSTCYQLGYYRPSDDQFSQVAIYGLTSPPTGTQTAVATFDANTYGGIGVISFTGTDTARAFSEMNARASSTASTAISTVQESASDEIVVDCCATFKSSGGTTATVGASQTQRVNAINGSSNTRILMSTETGAASTTMSWTNAVAADNSQVTIAVIPPQGGGGGTSGRQGLHSIGSGAI